MERGDIFVEVRREEIQRPLSSSSCTNIMSNLIVVIVCCLSGERSDLLVAPSVTGYEEYWNAFNLQIDQLVLDAIDMCRRTLMSSSMPPSRYRYKEYLLANLVCSVPKSEYFANDGRMYDIPQPLTSSCFVKNDWTMRNSSPKPSKLAVTVVTEHAQGFRNRSHRLARSSTRLSGVMSLANGAPTDGSFSIRAAGVVVEVVKGRLRSDAGGSKGALPIRRSLLRDELWSECSALFRRSITVSPCLCGDDGSCSGVESSSEVEGDSDGRLLIYVRGADRCSARECSFCNERRAWYRP